MNDIRKGSPEFTRALEADGQRLINNTKRLIGDMFQSNTKKYVVAKVKKAAMALGLLMITAGAGYTVIKLKAGKAPAIGLLPME